MKRPPLPVKSRYLFETMERVLSENGWTVQELAAKADLSYGYTRRIVNGTVIPHREALRRICQATSLNFTETWEQLRNVEEHQMGTYVPALTAAVAGVANTDTVAITMAKMRTIQDAAAKTLLNGVEEAFNRLPLEGQADVVRYAWELVNKYERQRRASDATKNAVSTDHSGQKPSS